MSTQEVYIITHPIRPRPRTRTSSLLSVCSGVSLGSVFEIAKSNSTAGVSQLPDTHEAYGAFIPVRSATSTLKDFASYVSPPITRNASRRRRVTFSDKCSYSSSWDDQEESSSSQIPYITRTTPSSPICPPSPMSTVSSLSTSSRNASTHDLHPILASLERKSRLCSQIVQCTTCRKTGSDFPRCPRCGDMWCSRPCRLVGGKRHACSGTNRA
ncbi:hypothetical protein BDZ97DRAFT_303206 [Flammula alnicola]|nr:hypothetical protein BDZ97DRAFT_303206 [Flammula alnicola]